MKFSKTGTIYTSITSWLKSVSGKNSFSCSNGCCENESISNEQKTTTNLETGKQEFESIACSLTESKLAKRKNELHKEVFSRVDNYKDIETGFILTFSYDEKFLSIMTEYIISEKRCCPFFTFEIQLNQTNDILLKIAGPLESKEMLEMFLAEYN